VGIRTLQEKGSAAAIPSFNRAIELDPNFAAAYEVLGISYSNLREPGLATENLQKSYDLRDRASERERLRISGSYYLLVTLVNSKRRSKFTNCGPRPIHATASPSGIWASITPTWDNTKGRLPRAWRISA
jgi:tetratricopeptide (TPR) repeat protein